MTAHANPGPAIVWFRRDLRLEDNTALSHALKSGDPVMPVFIFDKNILDKLGDRTDRRVAFIHQEVSKIKTELEQKYGSTLHVFHSTPENVFKTLIRTTRPSAVYANEDYEPYARQRDATIGELLEQSGIPFHLLKDHVIFAKDEIVKSDGTPYTVFTPYSKQWLAKLTEESLALHNISLRSPVFIQSKPVPLPSLADLGFMMHDHIEWPPMQVTSSLLKRYSEFRDIPAANGTSHLGMHLRFGTISIRQLARQAKAQSAVFLNELIWREFFQQILWHFPHVVDRCFRPQYEHIQWRNDESEFEAWCQGKTGYPMVDAGIRELNATGFMHNRVRMVVASFLTKHLLIDWRWGEAYFAEKLLDFELASNNGNWQWAAGTGCDAAPYFRIFNPSEQARKFDPDGKYIRAWIPEFGTSKYPLPIVDHQMARARALKTYREALAISDVG